MKTLNTLLMSICLAATAGTAAAADDMMKKPDGMAKDGMAKPMTMQDCKDHMAMAKKDGMKKDDAMAKKDATCADMMKKDEMMKPGMAASEAMPMKK